MRFLSALVALMLVLLPAQADSEDAHGWIQGLHSRVRLVSGDRRNGQWFAGVHLSLDPGFKTYWRSPGESGLPPRFDWSGSENVRGIEMRWPAPERAEDATGVSYVYHDSVLLPVIVTPADPAKPVRLRLDIEYGICRDICIPASATLTRLLGAQPSEQPAIDSSLKTRIPRLQAVGAGGAVSIAALEPAMDGKSGFTAVLRAPEGVRPNLFVEAPEGWYFSTSPPDARNRVAVTLDERPKEPGPVEITLTLVAGENSAQSTVRLDATGKPR